MAILAQGTTVKIDGSTVGTANVVIGKVTSFSGLDGEASEIDVTHLSSAAKEFALGLKDFGSFSLEYIVDYSDQGQDFLRSAGSATKTFAIELSDSTTLNFEGFVKNADSISGAVDGVVTGSASIKISGAVTES